MTNVFASFATRDFFDRRDVLCESASAVGFDRILKFSPDDYIGTDFAEKNKEILSLPRGAGYWIWKPWIIREALRSMRPGDVLVYSDAGRTNYYRFNRFPSNIIGRAKNSRNGFILGPAIYQHGPLSRWTKRDCLKIIDMDRSDIISRPIIQATWSVWTPTKNAIEFLDEWLYYCEDSRCLTDAGNSLGFKNYPNFIDHRHDQSILTLLAYKNEAEYFDFSDGSVFKILALRSESQLAHLFMKRIDDVEIIFRKGGILSLVKAFIDMKLHNS